MEDRNPTNPPDLPRMPSMEELLEMIDGLTDVPPEEKQQIKEEVLRGMGNVAEKAETVVSTASDSSISPEILLVFFLFLIVATIIGGIAYKLIKTEKVRTSKRPKKEGKAVKAKNKQISRKRL
ncbi:UNVERIFIED_CONTAM: hypothetical protein PYX00_007536 [Menopon gallinae]|uniref:Uncharacterized protein n=1 Tax=Menopon gallinae TaxID=328185 RepID=A0AAW2HKD3_9NEOP